MKTEPSTLTRQQIKAVYRRHHGEMSQLARELGIKPQSISDVLRKRRTSQRVETALRRRAAELIDQERGNA